MRQPGPKSLGMAIDVYLQPLIDELKESWVTGVRTYDAYANSNFVLRAALLWTINDFPAYEMLHMKCFRDGVQKESWLVLFIVKIHVQQGEGVPKNMFTWAVVCGYLEVILGEGTNPILMGRLKMVMHLYHYLQMHSWRT